MKAHSDHDEKEKKIIKIKWTNDLQRHKIKKNVAVGDHKQIDGVPFR